MYIPARGEGGFGGTKPGDHDFGGAAVTAFTGQVNSDVVDGRIRDDAPPAQLYDLDADLSQTQNVYEEHPAVAAELHALLDQIIRSSDASRPE